MTERSKQVSFLISDNLYRAVQMEKIAQDISFQKLVTLALESYTNAGCSKTRVPLASGDGRRFLKVCLRYFKTMPVSKRKLLEDYLILDLRHYGSARLKKEQ
jgi:hypothetical protein